MKTCKEETNEGPVMWWGKIRCPKEGVIKNELRKFYGACGLEKKCF